MKEEPNLDKLSKELSGILNTFGDDIGLFIECCHGIGQLFNLTEQEVLSEEQSPDWEDIRNVRLLVLGMHIHSLAQNFPRKLLKIARQYPNFMEECLHLSKVKAFIEEYSGKEEKNN